MQDIVFLILIGSRYQKDDKRLTFRGFNVEDNFVCVKRYIIFILYQYIESL